GHLYPGVKLPRSIWAFGSRWLQPIDYSQGNSVRAMRVHIAVEPNFLSRLDGAKALFVELQPDRRAAVAGLHRAFRRNDQPGRWTIGLHLDAEQKRRQCPYEQE